jgi:predicted dehydrogenase
LSVVSDHEDIAETRIEFEDGLVANLKASRISPEPARQMQIFGARGFAELDFSTPALSMVQPCDALVDRSFSLAQATDNPLVYADTLFANELKCASQELEPRNAILDELHDFVISVQTGISPTVSGHAGARAVETADAILAAIAKRCWYHDVKPSEVGPHAQPRERIESASRRIHQDRRAA